MKRVYSVTEFNKNLKLAIEDNPFFSNFFLKGEMSGVTYYKSGHLYFTLKDKNSQIRCAAFNYKMKRIPEDLKEGDQIEVFCDLGVYEGRGEIQILVRHIEKLDLLGDRFLQLEKLKKELEKAGYFSSLLKKSLPKYPKNIGIVTSYTGAALQDMIKTIRKRDSRINIYVFPAKVQGEGAGKEIIHGIETLDKISKIDLIIAGRGGGSIEDLWAFNEKEVALAFFHCQKPIISAVGHETDNLLSDLTADVRAATPTQAIEIAIPEKKHLEKEWKYKFEKTEKLMLNLLKEKEKELKFKNENYYIKNFSKEIEKYYRDITLKEEIIKNRMDTLLKRKEGDLNIILEKIINRNPIKILKRGYSITTEKGKNISSISELKCGDFIETRLIDGIVQSRIEKIKEEKLKDE